MTNVATRVAVSTPVMSERAGGLADRLEDGEQFDRAATISLYSNAPLTCQFMLEDHAVRHRYHHLAHLQAALKA